jgi:hypothetical protein
MWLHRRNSRQLLLLVCVLAMLRSARPMLSHDTLTTTVLFDREIVRILNKHCVMCHAQNGSSFPLETYEQTWLLGKKMRAAAIARHMPPWAAVQGYGEFSNDNSLTLREGQFIVSWVEGLGPRNAGTVFTNVANSSAPREPVRAKWDFGQWKRGTPNLVLNMEPAVISPGEGNTMKEIVVATGFKADQGVTSIEYMPGDPRVVRAAFLEVKETGQWIGSWTPWYGSMEAPRNTAYRVPAGSHILAKIYYRSEKVKVTDGGEIGLFFRDKPVPGAISDLTLSTSSASGDGRFRSEVPLTRDTHIVALRLDPPAVAKTVEVSERKTDGQTRVLLFAKDFSSDWPSPFIFKEPVLLRRGSVLSVTSYGSPVKLTASRY